MKTTKLPEARPQTTSRRAGGQTVNSNRPVHAEPQFELPSTRESHFEELPDAGADLFYRVLFAAMKGKTFEAFIETAEGVFSMVEGSRHFARESYALGMIIMGARILEEDSEVWDLARYRKGCLDNGRYPDDGLSPFHFLPPLDLAELRAFSEAHGRSPIMAKSQPEAA